MKDAYTLQREESSVEWEVNQPDATGWVSDAAWRKLTPEENAYCKERMRLRAEQSGEVEVYTLDPDAPGQIIRRPEPYSVDLLGHSATDCSTIKPTSSGRWSEYDGKLFYTLDAR
jgi:hypothetical protein